MSLLDQEFEKQGEAPEFPDELVPDLQQFVVVGHLSDTFTYGGQEFEIRTMTIGEELAALKAAQKYSDLPVATGRVYATAMVAGATQNLNGAPLVVPISEKQDVAAIKFSKVLDWFWPTIEVVYNRFSELERKQKEILDGLTNTLDESDESEESSDPVE